MAQKSLHSLYGEEREQEEALREQATAAAVSFIIQNQQRLAGFATRERAVIAERQAREGNAGLKEMHAALREAKQDLSKASDKFMMQDAISERFNNNEDVQALKRKEMMLRSDAQHVLNSRLRFLQDTFERIVPSHFNERLTQKSRAEMYHPAAKTALFLVQQDADLQVQIAVLTDRANDASVQMGSIRERIAREVRVEAEERRKHRRARMETAQQRIDALETQIRQARAPIDEWYEQEMGALYDEMRRTLGWWEFAVAEHLIDADEMPQGVAL